MKGIRGRIKRTVERRGKWPVYGGVAVVGIVFAGERRGHDARSGSAKAKKEKEKEKRKRKKSNAR